MKVLSEVEEMSRKAKMGMEACQDEMDDECKESFNDFLKEIRMLKKKPDLSMEDLEETKSACQQWIDFIYGSDE